MIIEGVHELLLPILEVNPFVDIDITVVSRERKVLHLVVHDHVRDVVLEGGEVLTDSRIRCVLMRSLTGFKLVKVAQVGLLLDPTCDIATFLKLF